MSVGEVIKEALASIPRFVQDFVNLVGSPRAYAASGRVFSSERYVDALAFLGISLLVTFVLKTPMFASPREAVPYLAADAAWKFAVVLTEAAIITLVWRLLKGRGGAGEYLVSTCFYFGVLSVLGHLLKLISFAIGQRVPHRVSGPLIFWGVYVGLGGVLLLWSLACWRTYGDFNRASLGRTILALVLVFGFSAPVLAVGLLLRDTLTNEQSTWLARPPNKTRDRVVAHLRPKAIREVERWDENNVFEEPVTSTTPNATSSSPQIYEHLETLDEGSKIVNVTYDCTGGGCPWCYNPDTSREPPILSQ